MSFYKEKIEKIRNNLEKILTLTEENEECSYDLRGLELEYEGNYASVTDINAKLDLVTLYVEDEEYNNWYVTLTLGCFSKLI